MPTAERLRFDLDHARARDAVYSVLDPAAIGCPYVLVESAAGDRAEYLRRPDLGRRLSEASRGRIERGAYDVAFVVADGLSALAVHRHAGPLLEALLPKLADWNVAPLVVAKQGRVGIGDEIGERLGADLVAVLIGERPGLMSPDSLGVYLTWGPRPGRTDAERNCLSNIRAEGLSYALAAHKLYFLMAAARGRRLTGVALKEDASPLPAAT